MIKKLYVNTSKVSTKLDVTSYNEIKVFQASDSPANGNEVFINQKYFNFIIKEIKTSFKMKDEDAKNHLKMQLQTLERDL